MSLITKRMFGQDRFGRILVSGVTCLPGDPALRVESLNLGQSQSTAPTDGQRIGFGGSNYQPCSGSIATAVVGRGPHQDGTLAHQVEAAQHSRSQGS